MIISQPTPELPVRDVATAQVHYRDRLGFKIEWHDDDGGIGAVSHGPCAIFFRKTDGDIHPCTFWVFTKDIDATYEDLERRGAHIFEPITNTKWGMRQFALRDPNGHVFYFHHDL